MGVEAPERRLLVVGASGQVGYELRTALSGLGRVTTLDRASADLAVAESLRSAVQAHRPHVIVNAAAYTAVDRAESEAELAHLVNGAAPGVLADAARSVGACMVHYSTDYVFDGGKKEPYDELDAPNPLSVYGQSKLAGERSVASACERHIILRASWVLGFHGANFLKTMLRLAAERDSLRVVADQVGAPTAAELIAGVTTSVLRTMLDAPSNDARWGLYHLTATGETTWHAYAVHVIRRARELGMRLRATPEDVVAIGTADYPTPARRPANSRLNTARLRAAFGVQLPHWTHGVDRVIEQLRSA